LTKHCLKFYLSFQVLNLTEKAKKSVNTNINIPVSTTGETTTVFASDYLNKLSGERIERECKRQLDAGAKTLVVNFAETEIVNSIGVSILLGVIDAASNAGARVVFSDVNDDTIELFEMLGLTNHVVVQN
jgi:anti-anti-sigma regulatory factor